METVISRTGVMSRIGCLIMVMTVLSPTGRPRRSCQSAEMFVDLAEGRIDELWLSYLM